MSTDDGIHTTTNPKGTGWVNKARGVILSSHRAKANAIARGRQLAKRYGMLLTIHLRDGNVIETRSYAAIAINTGGAE